MTGKTYDVPPMAPDPASTDYFEVGPLRIGIEYRRLDPATIEAHYQGDAAHLAEIREHSPDGGFSDEGVSIHVESLEDAHEYLRFDAFADDPHYHYVDRAAGTNTIVEYDAVAHGEMLPWVLGCLATRLPRMLERAGAAQLAARIDPALGRQAAERVDAHLKAIGFEAPR